MRLFSCGRVPAPTQISTDANAQNSTQCTKSLLLFLFFVVIVVVFFAHAVEFYTPVLLVSTIGAEAPTELLSVDAGCRLCGQNITAALTVESERPGRLNYTIAQICGLLCLCLHEPTCALDQRQIHSQYDDHAYVFAEISNISISFPFHASQQQREPFSSPYCLKPVASASQCGRSFFSGFTFDWAHLAN